MKKRIADMTPVDKASFLEATKKAMWLERGVRWEEMEKKIQDNINATFDDERFVKMSPDDQIDAAFARKEFGKNKPELIDYMLWSLKFVTHSDAVEW